MQHDLRTCDKTSTFLSAYCVFSKNLGAVLPDSRTLGRSWWLHPNSYTASHAPGTPELSWTLGSQESSRPGDSEPPGAQLPPKAAVPLIPKERVDNRQLSGWFLAGSPEQ